MTRQPFAHQDASGMAGAPVAIFVDGVFAEYVDRKADPYGQYAMERIIADRAPYRPSVEAVTECMNHPKTPAVDCVICDPMEG